MTTEIFIVLLIPFLGTCLGAACLLFMTEDLSPLVRKALAGFAGGVMVAASIWSLLQPAIEASEYLGKFSFLPAVIGFWLGTGFLLLLDNLIPHLHVQTNETEGPHSSLSRTIKVVLAITLHNIPEGMALGVVLANWLSGAEVISWSNALALAIGIAIQNFPEGAIVSMPLQAEGTDKSKAFLYGTISGIVEPLGGLVTILLIDYITPLLPYLLASAAGAMMYVVVEELIPDMAEGHHSNIGVLAFSSGFTLMMILDIALG